MGEIADMMLEGDMCQICGKYLGEGDGYPTICGGCQSREGVDEFGNEAVTMPEPKSIQITRYKCPTCKNKGRHFPTIEAYEQHWRDKHER